jgi:hypothetical protein
MAQAKHTSHGKPQAIPFNVRRLEILLENAFRCIRKKGIELCDLVQKSQIFLARIINVLCWRYLVLTAYNGRASCNSTPTVPDAVFRSEVLQLLF